MFNNEELKIIGEVLGQLNFKPGQGLMMSKVEAIIMKIKNELEKPNKKEEK